MPLDKKTTKNGIDLNEVDVSKLALVDKDNLLDDLTKRLKQGIRESFQEALADATDYLKESIADSVSGQSSGNTPATPPQRGSGNSGGGSGSGSGPGGNPSPRQSQSRQPNQKQQNSDFEKLLKMQRQAEKLVERAVRLQKKKNKDKSTEQRRGQQYSDAGKRISESIDDVAEDYHTYDQKELQKALQTIEDIKETIKFKTANDEQKILTQHTEQLQKAVLDEIRSRKTTLGKIGGFFTKNNANVAGLVAGVTGNSPLAGLAVKYAFDRVRKHRENAQDAKSKSLKLGGKLQKNLPRQQESEVGDSDVKLDDATLHQTLHDAKDADERHSTIERLFKNGHITAEQRQAAQGKFLPQGFSTVAVSHTTNHTGATGSPTAHSPERIPVEEPELDVGLQATADRLGKRGKNRKREANEQSYESSKRSEAESLKRQITDAEKKYDELSKTPEGTQDDEVFGSPAGNAKSEIGVLHKKLDSIEKILHDLDRKKADQEAEEKRLLEFVSKNADNEHLARAAHPETVERVNDEEPVIHPERVPGDEEVVPHPKNVTSITQGKGFKIEEDEDKQLQGIHKDESKLERLTEQQLTELKEINKTLKDIMSQADLAHDAALRNTNDKSGLGLMSGAGKGEGKAGAEGEGGSGVGGWIKGAIAEHFAGKGIGKVASWWKARSAAKAASTAAKTAGKAGKVAETAEGVAGGLGEAGKGVEAVSEVAKGASVASKAGKVGLLSRLFGGGASTVAKGAAEGAEVAGGLGKMGTIAKFAGKAGKLALPLAILGSAMDASEGVFKAGSILGKKDRNVKTGERVLSGGVSAFTGLASPVWLALDAIGKLTGHDIEWGTTGKNVKEQIIRGYDKRLYGGSDKGKQPDLKKAQEELKDAATKTGSNSPTPAGAAPSNSPTPVAPGTAAAPSSPTRANATESINQIPAVTPERMGVPTSASIGRMKASPSGLAFIKNAEGFIPNIYPDVGNPAIGYGTNLTPDEAKRYAGKTISKPEAEALMMRDVRKAEAAVNRLVKVPLTQGQFDALVSYTYNRGEGHAKTKTRKGTGLAGSSVLKKVNANDMTGAAIEMEYSAVTAHGKRLQGLVDRRKAESQLFSGTDASNKATLTSSANAPSSGLRLAKVSSDSSVMNKVGAMSTPSNGNTVIAPQSTTVNNNTTQMTDLRAKNTESTYQRLMNSQYVST